MSTCFLNWHKNVIRSNCGKNFSNEIAQLHLYKPSKKGSSTICFKHTQTLAHKQISVQRHQIKYFSSITLHIFSHIDLNVHQRSCSHCITITCNESFKYVVPLVLNPVSTSAEKQYETHKHEYSVFDNF